MCNRKQMKKQARQSLKRHYFMFVFICVFAAFMGSEFSESLSTLEARVGDLTDRFTGAAQVHGVRQLGLMDVALAEVQGRLDDGERIAKEIESRAAASGELDKGQEALGRSRGVLAGVVNAITSGSILVSVVAAIRSIVGSSQIAVSICIVFSLLLSFAVWAFLSNMFIVVSRRIFLEGRVYEKLPIQRFLFLLRVKKWTKVSMTMLLTAFFKMLWSLTVVGGIIKRYSYYLVPYIAAENPDISPIDAIRLSKKMMHGHKWECFLFELSFIGWYFLGIIFGLSAVLYSNPYKVAAMSEYYAKLRALAIEARVEGYERLNDPWLFEKPGEEAVRETYADAFDLLKQPMEVSEPLTGVAGFFANVFGVTSGYWKKEKEYEELQVRQAKYRALSDEIDGYVYPGRLFSIPEKRRRQRVETIHYLRHYSVWSLILIFFIMSMVGWVWEVSLHLITNGEFVNRGVMYGPWLPIYGSGAVLMLLLLNRLRRRPALEFLSIIVLCGLVEYMTAWYLETANHGQKWWDYSGYFLNLHGRICAEGLLVFGLGGLVIVYVAAPLIDNLLLRMNRKVMISLCVLLLALFLGDQIYSFQNPNSGEGITDDYSAAACADAPGQPLLVWQQDSGLKDGYAVRLASSL